MLEVEKEGIKLIVLKKVLITGKFKWGQVDLRLFSWFCWDIWVNQLGIQPLGVLFVRK